MLIDLNKVKDVLDITGVVYFTKYNTYQVFQILNQSKRFHCISFKEKKNKVQVTKIHDSTKSMSFLY